MIGSRLLFAGYGCGFKSRPLHAGFLAQDVLLVHDEAHLEPAFQRLISAIQSEQKRCSEFRAFHVMELTATSRGNGHTFHLGEADRQDEVIRRRIHAAKGLVFHSVDNAKQTAETVSDLAFTHENTEQAILVFLRKLEDVETVASKLRNARHHVKTLTGTMRGLERDALAKENPIFARFQPGRNVVSESGTVYLVCTSAGEVGVNISADHLVCDITPFDSMAQRFGRVNRWGTGDARVDVVFTRGASNAVEDAAGEPTSSANTVGLQQDFDMAVRRTVVLLHRLPKREDGHYDASPAALGDLPAPDRLAAFTPPPRIPEATDMLFDVWALTSIKGRMPGRPAVTDWLRGEAEWEPPQTTLAWRAEVGILTTDELLELNPPSDLLEDYPLKAHETLHDRTDRVFKHLQKVAYRQPDLPVWIITEDNTEPTVATLVGLIDEGKGHRICHVGAATCRRRVGFLQPRDVHGSV
jgi:CRISPR-associated endonuclease/helicase Cas3